ncbi:MAG: helix-turn-helix domain-containing protein [Bacteroidota bacterium]
MNKQSEFQIEASPLIKAVRKAVDDNHMSLSDIANRAGLSVPTIGRLYSEKVEYVQAKTARRMGEALGYEVEISKKGVLKLLEMANKLNSGKLTSAQKAKLLRAFQRLLDEL